MRLMHCGYVVNVVGEIVTPSIVAGDLMVVISGSGETEQLISCAKRAKLHEASTVLITARLRSTLAEFVDEVIQIGDTTSYGEVKGMPMGTAFELSSLCFLEAVVSRIMDTKGISEQAMKTRHANLE